LYLIVSGMPCAGAHVNPGLGFRVLGFRVLGAHVNPSLGFRALEFQELVSTQV
jgi:hypothetical protein